VSVLIVDDTPDVRRSLAAFLARKGLAVREALVCEVDDELLPAGRIVFAGAGGTADLARASGTGCDYVDLPVDREQLLCALRSVADDGPRRRAGQPSAPNQFITVSPKMCALRQRIERIATLDSTVLITGETGTGKEVIAREIFQLGTRRWRNFVPVNCGAIPEHLVESELFGHKKGAFTNAIADRKGLVEQADGGMLFLDEIGEMPASMQVRLLRFLDSGGFRRLGDTGVRCANLRIVAATNRPLEEDLDSGRFRPDLFHRLNVVSVRVPPLRERREDIAPLARHHLQLTMQRLPTKVRALSEEALMTLERQQWPGNVRELQNVIESAVVLVTGDTITADDLDGVLLDRSVPAASAPNRIRYRHRTAAIRRGESFPRKSNQSGRRSRNQSDHLVAQTTPTAGARGRVLDVPTRVTGPRLVRPNTDGNS